MANEIIQSIKQGSFIKVEQAARALKGVCLNHGFTELSDIAKNIEMQAKMNVSSELLITALDEAVEEVINVIAVLLEREGIDER